MPSIIKNADAENILREILIQKGYSLSSQKKHGETGVDIIATKGTEKYYIEVIGHKSSGPARAKDFYEAFFRTVSRIKDGAKICILSLPINAKRGLPMRAKQYGEAWKRIGKAFPELEIWLINVDFKTIEKTAWNDWLV